MLALISKDFAVQKRSLLLFLMIGLIIFFSFGLMEDAGMMTLIFPVFVVGYSFVNRSLYEDERNHSLRLLLAFPLARKQLVRAKYASVALFFLALILLFWLIGGFMGLNDVAGEPGLSFLVLSGTIFGFVLLVSIYLPIAYKVGMIRAQTVQRFLFIGLFALGTSAGAVFTRLGKETGGPPPWLNDLLEQAAKLNVSVYSLVLLALSVVLYLASMSLSIRFFERRELF
ncbi:ABC-2 transporter permease [Gorillibacterium timonense]|uniref:ABC-2 transporter permease n=1 Tax=Gorillibacterium timonense TaxID=1689269 RepID=UPI00071E0C52|nr:ABC-2 transporter permease [Gorillibacterium timonense]